MAHSRTGSLMCQRNARLDSFLQRKLERRVYERIRTYEPCVVLSQSINKVYMHVVLSDECVYLTEYPPRTLTVAVSFRRVRYIELVNDLPDFLRGKHRERCQHIRIVYVTEKPAVKQHNWLKKDKKEGLPPAAPPSRRNSHCPEITSTLQGFSTESSQWRKEELPPVLKHTRSASCPNPETLGLMRVPQPSPFYSPSVSPTSSPLPSEESLKTLESGQSQRSIGSVLSRLLRRGCVDSEEREAELHLYAVSEMSRLYLHLQSSWNSFSIRSTLLLDPLYKRRNRTSLSAPAISWERTAHLFGQLSSELLQDGISMESMYLLLQELRTAAHRSVTLRRLFWRSSEVCTFLLHTLEGCLHGCQSLDGLYTADQLLLSSLIVDTLAIMFRETEVEAARLSLLSAKKGALASRMLHALICDPQPQTQSGGSLTDSELQALLAKYLDTAASLLFELLLVGHVTSRCVSADNFLSVSWILRVLQPHPHLLSFIGYQVQQVVLVLTSLQESVLSPVQSVLLFQRLHLPLACLQYNSQLAQHLRLHFREEFRYSVMPSGSEKKLPPHYPISRPTLRLVEHIWTLILLSGKAFVSVVKVFSVVSNFIFTSAGLGGNS